MRTGKLAVILLCSALTATRALSQSATATDSAGKNSGATSHKTESTAAVSVVTGVRIVEERGLPALEILSTLPSVPSIQFLNSPPRLVIDLLHARLGLQEKDKRIAVQQENIRGIRAEQHQTDPPVVRVVLDLLSSYGYTWDEAGNRLMIRLKPFSDATAARKSSPRRAVVSGSSSSDAGIVPVSAGGGDVMLAGTKIAAGSSLTTSEETTVLQLGRGGEVRLCPRTTVSVTPSKNAQDLMLGMSTGALETHYALKSSADTIVTPDFRILFAGPGEFDFAVSTDAHGDTCVRGLSGNTSSAIVSELIGDRIYQVKPTEQVVFRSGQIDKVDSNVPLECGCPPPVPVEKTNMVSPPASDAAANAMLTAGKTSSESGGAAAGKVEEGRTLSSGSETQPLPASQPNDIHVEVDAPFVFHGKKSAGVAPAQTEVAESLPVMEAAERPAQLEIQVQPPQAAVVATTQAPHRSATRRFVRRIRDFFSAIFQ